MPNKLPQNVAHSKLYRELKRRFKNRQIPAMLFKETIRQVMYASKFIDVDFDAPELSLAFTWNDSPQGREFWNELNSLILRFPAPRQHIE